ncbi:chromate efflux transporter [Microbacterium lushaniae]|nr:chromate efflux transporter [Microbacterium lushaniae]KAA9153364.1 chromate efflux transporter [Microbacterium lushaniae]
MRGSTGEVFRAFLKLGLTSFGGPIAHLGYFRDEFVTRRRWLDDARYADLVALGQVLPGPTSSQVGFALGMLRAGVYGALAAFVAFTLPSAVIMVALAAGAAVLSGPIAAGVVHGLTIVAVAVVAQAVWGMARALTPDARRATIAAGAVLLALFPGGPAGQLLAIALGAAAGLVLCRGVPGTALTSPPPIRLSRAVGVACLAAFAVLVVALPLLVLATGAGDVALFDAFFRAGSLVFGGGHVVLPLLEAAVVDSGWLGADAVLTGYGAAQALPGPLFTFAAYLGALVDVGPGGILGAAVATVAIFLPGLLLLVGVLPFWGAVRRRTWAEPLLRGANAAVVGILGAALYTPLFTTAIRGAADFALALGCFVLLSAWRWPSWAVVLVGAAGGIALALVP